MNLNKIRKQQAASVPLEKPRIECPSDGEEMEEDPEGDAAAKQASQIQLHPTPVGSLIPGVVSFR
jgi:hypothetical protein